VIYNIVNTTAILYGKDGFTEISELNTNLKIISLNHQNNYIGQSNWLLEYQNF